MAESERVAGIYSEIQYRFDRQSIRNLRNFKKDLREVRESLDVIKRKARGVKGFGMGGRGQTQQAQKVAESTRRTSQYQQNNAHAARKGVAQYQKQNRLLQNSKKHAAAVNRAKQRETKASQQAAQYELKKQQTLKKQQQTMRRLASQGGGQGNQRNIQRLKNAQERLNRALRDGTMSLERYRSMSQRVNNTMRRQTMVAQQTSRSFTQLRTAIAGATGAFSAFAGGVAIQNIGGQFEDAGIMMETAMKDKAGEAMQFLLHQSRRLGIGATQSAKGFARYALAGQRLGFSFEEVKEQFLGVAEAATVFGLTQQEITGTIRALEQMAAKGQVKPLPDNNTR